MMRRSLFVKYFLTCASLIMVSIGIMGLALLLFASQHFKTERYAQLQRNIEKASEYLFISAEMQGHEQIFRSENLMYLNILADAVGADIFLLNEAGEILLCTEESPCGHIHATLPEEVMSQLRESGHYREIGNLAGVYEANYYTVGVPITVNDQVVGYMMSSSNSTAALEQFLIQILKMFLISATLVLIVVCIIIYFVTYQLVKPLKEMSGAAKKFGDGDFSTRLRIHSYDEVGELAISLNNMAQSLSTLETMRRSFISNVSHELKTPMQTIGGFIDGILDGTIPADQQKKYLRIVSDEIKRLSMIVRTMLELARIEAGQIPLDKKPVDLVELICKTLFSLERQIEGKQLTVSGLETDKIHVEADENLIQQVIYNLVENAIKFSNPEGYLEFGFRREGATVHLQIKNSGEGIAADEIPLVFDRFYKSDRSRGQDKSGVGLGLYIVRSIVSLHGGVITVESVQGEYCAFTVSLPAGKSALPPPARTKPRVSNKPPA